MINSFQGVMLYCFDQSYEPVLFYKYWLSYISFKTASIDFGMHPKVMSSVSV